MLTDLEVLRRVGFSESSLLASGGEATVYSGPNDRILRLFKPGAEPSDCERHESLLREICIAASNVGIATPDITSVVQLGGRVGTIERRLPGVRLTDALKCSQGSGREQQLDAWLTTASHIADIPISRPYYGDLNRRDMLSDINFHSYWTHRLSQQLIQRQPLFANVDIKSVVLRIPEPDKPRLVHLDLYGDNLLWDSGKITAVLDFGYSTIMGDGRLNTLFAATYALCPFASPKSCDEAFVRDWLKQHVLIDHLRTAEQMAAAYWSFAEDDQDLAAWCRAVLRHNRSSA